MKNSILGIDIGGSKIRAALWNGKRILKVKEVKTPKSLAAFKRALRNLATWRRSRQVGIAVPGRVRGTIFASATNIPYIKNLNFMTLFSSKGGSAFGGKIKVDHDARCFARAEYQNLKTTLFLTLGTGVGRAVGKSGKILKIKKFEYPERWEGEYQKIRDGRDNNKLAYFLAAKLRKIIIAHKPALVTVGGGVAERKKLLRKLEELLNLPVKKSRFRKDAVAVGAAMLFFR